MYNASNAFHQAVKNGNDQKALLIFPDCVFTNNSIDVSRGIEFDDYFNTNEDLSIGQALSNEISFSLFNDTGLLNSYEFGDFIATLGVQIGSETVTQNGTVYLESESHTYVASDTAPYLTRDGRSVTSQPVRPIICMIYYDGYVYCRLQDGGSKVYRDSTGTAQTKTLNSFMAAQMDGWSGRGISYLSGTRILHIWQGTSLRTYEFVPLGKFTAERPNVPTVIEIAFTCNDYMQKFEKDMPGDSDLGITYPISIGNLLKALCDYTGTEYKTLAFINSGAMIQSRPDEFDSATMRDVVGWIAEAAGSVARFDRDGRLKMDWIRATTQSIDETGYSEFNPYWYETKQITKVYNRASNGEYDNTSGDGDEGYLIQDNPLLKGVS